MLRAVYLLLEPIKDIDSYWHVVLGREILRSSSLQGLGTSWAWYEPVDPWRTSQWGSEVAMAAMVDTVGWTSLVAAKVAAGAVAAALVAVTVRRRCSPRMTALITVLVLAAVTTYFQDRPGAVSLMLLVAVGATVDGQLRRGTLPPWWWAPIMVLWANLHGAWIVAIAAQLYAGILGGARHQWTGREWRSFAVRMGGITAAGLLNPLTWRSLTLPFEFSGRTAHIIEWRPTTFVGVSGAAAVLLLVLLATTWARTGGRVPRSELAFAFPWLVFALTAERNLPVSVLILTPLLAARANEALGWASPPRRHREQRYVAAAMAALATIALLALPLRLASIDPLANTTPLGIAEYLQAQPDPLVLNEYNAAGPLVAFGPPGIVLTIDGRADRYPAEYVERHQGALRMQPGWRAFIDEVGPDYVVAYREAPVVEGLQEILGWRVALEDDPFLLLVAPDQGRP